jgi:hypothetical protein
MYTQDLSTTSYPVSGAIADCLDTIQRKLKRTLTYAQYTENLYVYKNGIVYPSAYPLDRNMPVSSTSSTPGNAIFQGAGIWVGWFVPLPALPVWEGVVPPQTDVTYWGGYSGSLSQPPTPGVSGPPIPFKLKRAICRAAWFLRNPAALTGMPGGVTSINQGGVAIGTKEGLSSFVESDPALCHDLRGFVRRTGKHWDDGAGA